MSGGRLACLGVMLSAAVAAAHAQQLTIGAYHLQGAVRTSLTQYDYTYTTDVADSGATAQGVVATVTSSNANTVIVKGSVQIGTVPANGLVTSQDTFVLRQNRLVAFDPGSLTWSFTQSNGLSLSTTAFDFGGTFPGSALTKTVVTVTNTGGGAVTLQPVVQGAGFAVVGGGCGGVLATGASCAVTVQFLPTASGTQLATGVLTLGVPGVAAAQQSVALRGESASLTAGQVTPTANPQVALYSLTLPYAGSWTVHFGPTTSYGRSTSVVTAATPGAAASIYVAGMLPNTTYHIQATVTLADGATTADVDHTFQTGALLTGFPASFPTVTTAGQTPLPGIELIDSLGAAVPTTALATDLQGNVIWTYPLADATKGSFLYPVKLLDNGHFLTMIAPIYPSLPAPGLLNVLREIDLAGNTVQQLTMDQLNSRLAANGFALTLADFSHDVVLLPNGHYLVIANTIKPFTDLPGYPGVTQVAGDVVVDLDSTMQPRWVWNSFDHLDVNRHPMAFPDWTHANSVAYSKDDGDFIISLRHQNWVLKVDYANGAGSGNIVWRLGEGGDFTLQGGVDPTDWFYAQHYAEFISKSTAGVFSLELFDNGDDRQFPTGTVCGTQAGQTPCHYSTVVQMQLDETAKTAKFLFHDIIPANLYSSFAGNTDQLSNGNVHYNLAGVGATAYTFEVTPGATLGATPQTVWQMTLPGTNTYRTLRLPSLYPGVQW